jgi:hypothetical protein
MIFSSAFRAGSIDRLRSLKPTPTKILSKNQAIHDQTIQRPLKDS